MDISWKDLLLKHPFTCLVAGPTMCGKSVFVQSLISHASEMITPRPERIVWCYGGGWQESFANFPNVEFISGLHFTQKDSSQPVLLIIDDLMCETDESVTKLFTKGCHHQNMSVIYIVQNLFHKGKEQRTISLNSNYLVVFKNPRDVSQITHLAKQIAPGNTRMVYDAFRDATSHPFGYLFFDFKATTPEELRLRTNIFPDQTQIVYLAQ
jgi:hypothetical protein